LPHGRHNISTTAGIATVITVNTVAFAAAAAAADDDDDDYDDASHKHCMLSWLLPGPQYESLHSVLTRRVFPRECK